MKLIFMWHLVKFDNGENRIRLWSLSGFHARTYLSKKRRYEDKEDVVDEQKEEENKTNL